MTIADSLIQDFDREVEHARNVLAAVPEDRFDFKPHDRSMSLGQLAGHIAENPSWVADMVEDEFDFAAMEAEYTPFVPTGRAEALAALDRNAAIFRDAVAACDDAAMHRTWTARRGDQVVMSMPRHVAIRSTAIHHFVHHRGQLTVYLRLLDAPVPQTYGPTADFPQF